MKARYHFLVAVIVLVPLVIWESPSIIIPFLLGSVLIDCDHEIDFFIMKKRITFSVTELSKTLEGNEGTYLPLHSYEAIIISAILMHWHIFFFGIYFGLIIHICPTKWSCAFGLIGMTIQNIFYIIFIRSFV